MPASAETCIYCGGEPAAEGEHVFPNAWYPDSTPESVQRLKVPSCRACNQRWHKIEDQLAQEMVLVTSPEVPAARGVHPRLARSWQPTAARSAADFRHRRGKLVKIARTMAWALPRPGRPQVDVRLDSGIVVKASPARSFGQQLVRGIAEKFVRGLHFAESGERIPALEVQARIVNPAFPGDWGPLLEIMQSLPINESLGPGFWYRRHHEPQMSAWAFLIWGQVTILALAKREQASVA